MADGNPKDDVLSLRVSADLSGALKVVADRHGITVSDLVRLGAEDAIKAKPADLRERLVCPTCKGSGQRFKTREANGLHHELSWAEGVRWAAAESDAQAAGREPVYVLDITDHLRACADDPQRKSAVARDRGASDG